VDEFRIAVAETFDVIVEPSGQDAFTLFAQDMGRTGHACGTLAVRHGLQAPVPALDPRPLLTMADMAHDHGGGHAMPMAHGAHGGHDAHAGHGDTAPKHPASERRNPLVDMQTSATSPRLDDPGIVLRNN